MVALPVMIHFVEKCDSCENMIHFVEKGAPIIRFPAVQNTFPLLSEKKLKKSILKDT